MFVLKELCVAASAITVSVHVEEFGKQAAENKKVMLGHALLEMQTTGKNILAPGTSVQTAPEACLNNKTRELSSLWFN